jgi:hypothetical protein
MMFAKINDDKSIVRDCTTNAILAVDKTALQNNRNMRRAAAQRQEEMDDLKNQVARLTTLVEQLLQNNNK